MNMYAFIIAAVIQLTGVVGDDLRARAFLDANNVKVGDPLTLTVDFIGEADFKSLHPPRLSRYVNATDWKLDDASAKTDTFKDARRLTYRIRPMRPGVLWFPALEFEYASSQGEKRTVRANTIPVHAKAFRQVVVKEVGEDMVTLPSPGEIVTKIAHEFASDDERFAWRKACANPDADAFAKFDFPEARLNEAVAAINAGNWARALEIYRALEWRIGQTAAIERGIVAALARKYDNPAVELPMWRQIGRPLLKFPWLGRVGIVLGAFALLALMIFLCSKVIRKVAALAFALMLVLPNAASAQDPFQAMEEQFRQMQERMDKMAQGMGGGFGFRHEQARKPMKIVAKVAMEPKAITVGEMFEFIISIELPRTATIEQVQVTPSIEYALDFSAQASNLPDADAENPSNVIKRISVPVRCDAPMKTKIKFEVRGMLTTRSGGGQHSFFSMVSSRSFRVESAPIDFEVRPLPQTNQPSDFSGIIAEDLRILELPDILSVETNDVIRLSYRVLCDGFVPKGYMPKDCAYEIGREGKRVEYMRYFVADGVAQTPVVSISYFDPRKKEYRSTSTGGTKIIYKTVENKESKK